MIASHHLLLHTQCPVAQLMSLWHTPCPIEHLMSCCTSNVLLHT